MASPYHLARQQRCRNMFTHIYREVVLMSRTKRLGAVMASLAFSATMIAGLSVSPADAAITGNYCDGHYLCTDVVTQTNSDLVIHMWAPVDGFTGHFELQLPSGPPVNSADQRWNAGSGPTFDVLINYGFYCATAWAKTGSTYTKLGFVCFAWGAD